VLRWSTPVTTTLFLVSTVSGVALFLHLGSAYFREMHEILSLVLLVPVVVHLWRNWPSFVGHLRSGRVALALVLSLVVAGAFAIEGIGASGGNPVFAAMARLARAPLADVAPALGLTLEDATGRFAAAGVADVKPTDAVADIAARSGRETSDLMAVLVAP
jgi:hypothetical protein